MCASAMGHKNNARVMSGVLIKRSFRVVIETIKLIQTIKLIRWYND